jgi:hypothetical protein
VNSAVLPLDHDLAIKPAPQLVPAMLDRDLTGSGEYMVAAEDSKAQ